MWKPVGPLRASVYWRRRWVAIASTVAVLVALAWSVAALAPSGGGTSTRPASRAAVSALQQTSPPPAASVPPAGPAPCADAMLSVVAEVERPEHRVGERPVLRLVVSNISDQPCVRDLAATRQETVVWSGDGANRLWSSNDCANAAGADLRTLVPGQPVSLSVRWAGRTSTPGCGAARTVVPAGAYRVMTRVDDVISAPTPFVRTA